MIQDPYIKLQRVPINEIVLLHLFGCSIERRLKEHKSSKKIATVLNSHSDLVSGVYEGGLKVWECALDLVEFLSTENILENGMKILELGCGAGLPGIFAFLKGATVHFQDFNYEVLDLLTIPNVLLNSRPIENVASTRCRFFAGDWTAVGKYLTEVLDLKNDRYDIILTSETIYNIDNQPKLLHLMKSTLKSTGTIYLASKTHYFGLGGGTRQFEELVHADGTFDIKVCQVVSKGLQKEVLQMNFRA
ncbi:histidine protein methyltransferase 1 homolog isoform X2 [Tachypleus tridentatus]